MFRNEQKAATLPVTLTSLVSSSLVSTWSDELNLSPDIDVKQHRGCLKDIQQSLIDWLVPTTGNFTFPKTNINTFTPQTRRRGGVKPVTSERDAGAEQTRQHWDRTGSTGYLQTLMRATGRTYRYIIYIQRHTLMFLQSSAHVGLKEATKYDVKYSN